MSRIPRADLLGQSAGRGAGARIVAASGERWTLLVTSDMGKGKIRGGNAKLQGIKNKVKRVEVYQKMKKETDKDQRKQRRIRQKEVEALGEEAPRPVQRTLESTREADDTFVGTGDDEVAGEDSLDEFASHFVGASPPRVLVTTGRYPSDKLLSFLEVVVDLFPNCEYRKRGAVPVKQVVQAACKRDFTLLLVFTEKAKAVRQMW